MENRYACPIITAGENRGGFWGNHIVLAPGVTGPLLRLIFVIPNKTLKLVALARDLFGVRVDHQPLRHDHRQPSELDD